MMRSETLPPWLRIIPLNKWWRDFVPQLAVRERFQCMMALFQENDLAHQAAKPSTGQNVHEEERVRRWNQVIKKSPTFYKDPLLQTITGGLSQWATRQLDTTAKAVDLHIRRAERGLAPELSDLAGEG